MQADGIGRGQRAILGPLPRHNAERAEARRRIAQGKPDLAHEIRHRRLPRRPRHRHDPLRLARIEGAGGTRQREAGIGDAAPGDVMGKIIRTRPSRHDRPRALRQRLWHETRAIRLHAGYGEEGENRAPRRGCRGSGR